MTVIQTNVRPQLHAGDHSKQSGKKLWHTYPNGNYWCGSWHERTPQQLLDECRSTIKDLKRNHPELRTAKNFAERCG